MSCIDWSWRFTEPEGYCITGWRDTSSVHWLTVSLSSPLGPCLSVWLIWVFKDTRLWQLKHWPPCSTVGCCSEHDAVRHLLYNLYLYTALEGLLNICKSCQLPDLVRFIQQPNHLLGGGDIIAFYRHIVAFLKWACVPMKCTVTGSEESRQAEITMHAYFNHKPFLKWINVKCWITSQEESKTGWRVLCCLKCFCDSLFWLTFKMKVCDLQLWFPCTGMWWQSFFFLFCDAWPSDVTIETPKGNQ